MKSYRVIALSATQSQTSYIPHISFSSSHSITDRYHHKLRAQHSKYSQLDHHYHMDKEHIHNQSQAHLNNPYKPGNHHCIRRDLQRHKELLRNLQGRPHIELHTLLIRRLLTLHTLLHLIQLRHLLHKGELGIIKGVRPHLSLDSRWQHHIIGDYGKTKAHC